MATKYITLNQLRNVVIKLNEKLQEKAVAHSDVPANTVVLGQGDDTVTLSCDGTKLLFTGNKEYYEGSISIEIPSTGNDMKVVVSNEGVGEIKELHTDSLVTHGIPGLGIMDTTYYSLPASTNSAKILSSSPGIAGGGTILTTKYRGLMHLVFDNNSYLEWDVGQNAMIPLSNNAYHSITELSKIAFTTENYDGVSGMMDECWIDITFPSGEEPAVQWPTYDTRFSNTVWAGGEPEWGNMAGKRIQIHVIGGIATYTVIE